MANKTPTPFTHLHVHTEYSLLDGISKIPDLVARAVEMEMDALAITDHGAMYAAIDFYSECKDQGIKPILGCELYLTTRPMQERSAEARAETYHATVLCQDAAGYENLVKLVTAAHMDGYYYRPRVDVETLAAHSSGLVLLSGCPSGELQRSLGPEGDDQRAAEIVDRYRQIFDDRYWLEIQRHEGVPNLDLINHQLVALSEKTGVRLVATNDSHYTKPDDHDTHSLYLAMQTQQRTEDEDRLMFKDRSYYLNSAAEMAARFADLPGAIAATAEIAQSCKLELDFGRKRLPEFPKPEGLNADQYLRKLCEEGFDRLCANGGPEYRQRLEDELAMVAETEFAEYFLIVWDIVRFAKQQNILLGVRGSAAASLVLYCLDITMADPIEHSLVFERFLNRERKEMPDIDMDFQDDRRGEVMRYVVERYGHRNVAQIMSFSRYGVKSALRYAARARGLDSSTAGALAGAAPGRAATIEDAISANPEMTRMGDADERVALVLKEARGLEGVVSHTSSHPAGVVISSEPLDQIAPLQAGTPIPNQNGGEDTPIAITQYAMDPIAKLGLLKMDFLALTNLTILAQTIEMVKDGPTDLAAIPLDDGAVYQLLGRGDTKGVFQLESGEMQRYIRELRPNSIGDISAMIALYRPGPMDNIDRFIRSKHGQEKITFPHPSMEDLLRETYGVIVYQDQVLQILQSFAGYSLGGADIVRKAMGKKIPKLMKDERDRFVEKAGQMGHETKTASEIFDIIEPFAGYAFNKAHSVSYALISYWTAWYKTHHPAAYMTASINCRLARSRDDYRKAIDHARTMRIPLTGPCINTGSDRTRLEGEGRIRLGTSCITGMPEAAVAEIAEERTRNGPFTSVNDFCSRAPRMTSKALETAIKAGALDTLDERATLLNNCKAMSDLINDEADARNKGQMSMFQIGNGEAEWLELERVEPADTTTLARWERETLGTAISWDPAVMLGEKCGANDVIRISELEANAEAGQQTSSQSVVGFVQSVETKKSRAGREFTLLELTLADGSIEVSAWDERVRGIATGLDLQTTVRATGQVTMAERGARLTADRLQDMDAGSGGEITITVGTVGDVGADERRMRRVLKVLSEHLGTDGVFLKIAPEGANRAEAANVDLVSIGCDGASERLRERLKALDGVQNVE